MDKAISAEEKRNFNPGLSAVLSFVYNGLGQLYNGQIKKGLVIISFSSLGIMMTVVGAILILHYTFAKSVLRLELFWGLGILIIGLLLICYVGIYSIYDAYNYSKRRLSE